MPRLQHERLQLFLVYCSFNDRSDLAVAKVHIVDLCERFTRVCHPEFKHIGFSVLHNSVATELVLHWEWLSPKAHLCLVEECLTAHRYNVVVLSHVHVSCGDPDFLRLKEFEILSTDDSCLLKLCLQELSDDWAPHIRALKAVPELFDLLLVFPQLSWLHLRDVIDIITAQFQLLAPLEEVWGGSFVQGSSKM